MTEEEELLIERPKYLAHGVHIGTKAQHADMEPYIFHVKKNQLAVINLEQTDQRIREVGEYLSDFDPEEILVVGRKPEVEEPIKAFSEAMSAEAITGRFMPGTLTNPEADSFTEPQVVLVTDPDADSQAVTEASHINVPVVAIADSENELEDISEVIPANNKSEKAVGQVLYLLAQQVIENRGLDSELEEEEFVPNPPETEEEEE